MKGYNYYRKSFKQLKVGSIVYKVNLSNYKIDIVTVEDIKLLHTQDRNRLTLARLRFSDGRTFDVGANFSSEFTKDRLAYYTTEWKSATTFVKTIKEEIKL